MGWRSAQLPGVETIVFREPARIREVVEQYRDAVHLVQGVYANGIMEKVRDILRNRRLRWGGVLETIDERSRWKAPLKRMAYRFCLSEGKRPDFILATGAQTSAWIANRGYLQERIFPFAYFLPETEMVSGRPEGGSAFRVGYVGQFIQRKRIDLLIDALSRLPDSEFTLVWVGDGPLHGELYREARDRLGEARLENHGTLPMHRIPRVMAGLDCLVLPSDHDGWGAVVVEAMMQGVPVVCSDACGASLAVSVSGFGEVFPKGDSNRLRGALERLMKQGPLPEEKRRELAVWARCFSAPQGGVYLYRILRHVYEGAAYPLPPWGERCCDISKFAL